jgi:hypothetical protein
VCTFYTPGVHFLQLSIYFQNSSRNAHASGASEYGWRDSAPATATGAAPEAARNSKGEDFFVVIFVYILRSFFYVSREKQKNLSGL